MGWSHAGRLHAAVSRGGFARRFHATSHHLLAPSATPPSHEIMRDHANSCELMRDHARSCEIMRAHHLLAPRLLRRHRLRKVPQRRQPHGVGLLVLSVHPRLAVLQLGAADGALAKVPARRFHAWRFKRSSRGRFKRWSHAAVSTWRFHLRCFSAHTSHNTSGGFNVARFHLRCFSTHTSHNTSGSFNVAVSPQVLLHAHVAQDVLARRQSVRVDQGPSAHVARCRRADLRSRAGVRGSVAANTRVSSRQNAHAHSVAHGPKTAVSPPGSSCGWRAPARSACPTDAEVSLAPPPPTAWHAPPPHCCCEG